MDGALVGDRPPAPSPQSLEVVGEVGLALLGTA
jgi:hypothetical protein